MLEPIQISRPRSATRTRSIHPLEPLSADEVSRAVELLRASGKVAPTTRFVSVSLHEPPKASVHDWDGEASPPREAFAVLFDNATNSCYEATLSLADEAVAGWKHVPGVQPTMTVRAAARVVSATGPVVCSTSNPAASSARAKGAARFLLASV